MGFSVTVEMSWQSSGPVYPSPHQKAISDGLWVLLHDGHRWAELLNKVGSPGSAKGERSNGRTVLMASKSPPRSWSQNHGLPQLHLRRRCGFIICYIKNICFNKKAPIGAAEW